MQKSPSSAPARLNSLQIAMRYIRDPWWLLLFALVGFISLFINHEVAFGRTQHAPPLGPFIHLYKSFHGVHHPIFLTEISERPLWSYLALWLYFFFGTLTVDFAINRLHFLLKRATAMSVRLHELLHSKIQDRKWMIFTRWIARLAIVLTGTMWIGVTSGLHNCLISLFKASIGLYLTWWSVQIVQAVIEGWRQSMGDPNAQETKQVFYFIGNVAKVTVIFVMSLLIANNLGLNIASILAPASLIGIGFATGAQESAKDIFGALSLFLDKPFRVGQRVRIDALVGTVENIGLRSIRIWDQDNCLVTLPNRKVTDATITILPQKEA